MSLADLTTEGRNPHSTDLDRLSAIEIVRLMNREDARVPAAVADIAEQVAAAIDIIADRLRRGGRLIYLGAGTSGRLGVLDAAECPPTFNSPPWQVVGLIAGGSTALVRAVEGAEDHEDLGVEDLQQVECCGNDVVVGIATSGRTPYVIGAMKHARALGCPVIGLSCNAGSMLGPHCDLEIVPIVGPEVVTGSTRLKAGTATKLVLNMLTTGAMVLLGKTYGNLMVDLQKTNEKLADRTERIVAELADLTRPEAAELLLRCDGDVKTAIVAHRRQLSPEGARELLRVSQGHLRSAMESETVPESASIVTTLPHLVLGIDGGGTRTRAWLAEAGSSSTDPIAVGEAGIGNPHSVGSTAALANIELAIRRAFANAEIERHPVAAVCLAVAGTGSPERQRWLRAWADRQRIADQIVVTHDAAPILAAGTGRDCGVALIAGTGSLAFGKSAAGKTARAGGWGYRLGDEGSGYDIALQALRAAVRDRDGIGDSTSLTDALSRHLELGDISQIREFIASEGTDVRTIAALAPLVLAEADAGDPVAGQILRQAGSQLAALVTVVSTRLFGQNADFELALSGGVLLNNSTIREAVVEELSRGRDRDLRSVMVAEPVRGTLLLARQALQTQADGERQ